MNFTTRLRDYIEEDSPGITRILQKSSRKCELPLIIYNIYL